MFIKKLFVLFLMIGVGLFTFSIVSNAVTPVANFTANVTTIELNGSVTFTDTSTNTPTSWLWNFGDNHTSTTQSPVHFYGSPGVYTVSLTATNIDGSHTETKVAYITVTADPMITGIINSIIDPLQGLLAGIGSGIVVYFQSLVLIESATPGIYTDALNSFGVFLFVLLGIGAAFGLATLVFNLVRKRA